MHVRTCMQVDSVNKQGLLLEVVQILTDMNLTICKSYISSDAGWFMDGVFTFLIIIGLLVILTRKNEFGVELIILD